MPQVIPPTMNPAGSIIIPAPIVVPNRSGKCGDEGDDPTDCVDLSLFSCKLMHFLLLGVN